MSIAQKSDWKSVDESPTEDGLYIVEWEDGTIGETSYLGFYGWVKLFKNVKRWKEREDVEERVTMPIISGSPYIAKSINDEMSRLLLKELEEKAEHEREYAFFASMTKEELIAWCKANRSGEGEMKTCPGIDEIFNINTITGRGIVEELNRIIEAYVLDRIGSYVTHNAKIIKMLEDAIDAQASVYDRLLQDYMKLRDHIRTKTGRLVW